VEAPGLGTRPRRLNVTPDMEYHQGPIVDLHPVRVILQAPDLGTRPRRPYVTPDMEYYQGPIVDLHPVRVHVPRGPNILDLPQPNL